MGADLVWAMVPMDYTEDQAKAKVEAITDWEPILSDLEGYFGLSYDTAEEAKELLLGCVQDVYYAYKHETRDIGYQKIFGTTFLFTGGMTWGDDPTDIYQSMSLADAFKLTTDKNWRE